MSLKQNFRVKATSTTEGTGTLTLVNASGAFRPFSSLGAGPVKCRYVIAGTSYFEVGVGTWTAAGPNTLSRDTVLRSSASDSLVSLPAGTHDVTIWVGAEYPVDNLTGSPTLTVADMFSFQQYTGTGGTITLPALASLPDGIAFPWSHTGSGNVTWDGNASETINGATTLVVGPGTGGWMMKGSAGWICIVGLTSVPAQLNAAQTFTAAQVIRAAATALLNLESTDAGAGEGPILDLHRDSASPAASDLLGAIQFAGESSTSVKRAFAKVAASILDAANTSEDATLFLQTIVAGTLATRVTVGQGLFMAGATGGDPGAGIINAVDYKKNGADVIGLTRVFAAAIVDTSGSGSFLHEVGFASLTRNGTGDVTLTFDDTLADSNFFVKVTIHLNSTNVSTQAVVRARATTTVRVQTGSASAGTAGDAVFYIECSRAI